MWLHTSSLLNGCIDGFFFRRGVLIKMSLIEAARKLRKQQKYLNSYHPLPGRYTQVPNISKNFNNFNKTLELFWYAFAFMGTMLHCYNLLYYYYIARRDFALRSSERNIGGESWRWSCHGAIIIFCCCLALSTAL